MVEARVSEANASRIKAEKKLEKNAAIAESWAQQVAKLQRLGTELADKCRATTEMLATSEGWLIHAKEKIKSPPDPRRRQHRRDATLFIRIIQSNTRPAGATAQRPEPLISWVLTRWTYNENASPKESGRGAAKRRAIHLRKRGQKSVPRVAGARREKSGANQGAQRSLSAISLVPIKAADGT
jgi:hypothetical protein